MKMKFGCIYRRKGHDTYNDQHYYVYIPVIWKDKEGKLHYRMVDTYVIYNPCYGDTSYEKHLWFLEQANQGETSWKIYHNVYDYYYYQNYYDLTSDELKETDWELIADLHDYKRVSADDKSEYKEEDIVSNIPLWNEDGYSWDYGAGYFCNYVRKDAKKDGTNMYITALEKYPISYSSNWELTDLENACKECLTMSLKRGYKTKIKNKLKEIKKFRQLTKEFEDFKNRLYKR